MKKTLLKLMIPAALAVLMVLGCSNPAGGGGGGGLPPETVTYFNTDTEGNSYELTINPDSSSRSAVSGDSYVLTVTFFLTGDVKTSTGTITVETSVEFILTPANAVSDTDTFTVTVNPGGGVIATLTVSGTVKYDGDDEDDPPITTPTMSVDKTELREMIERAIAEKTGIKAEGIDTLGPGDMYVTAIVMGTFEEAIADAQGVEADPAALEAAVGDAVDDLEEAIEEFKGAPKTTVPPDTPVTHGVTFNSNGGDAVPNQTVAEGSTVTEPSVPAKANHAFFGWYKEAAFTNLWNFATDTVTAKITLYARWIPTYTVTFDAKGETPEPEAQTVIEGGTVMYPEDPEKVNHVFDGWYTDTSYTTKWLFGVTTVSNSFTLHAKWLTGGEADALDFEDSDAPQPSITVTNKAQWESALSGISGGNNYVIIVNNDITGLAPGNIASASIVSLRGTGSLALGSDGSLITVGGSATLILRGPTLQGKDNNNGYNSTSAVVAVRDSGAKFIMESGTITGNTSFQKGGGVHVNHGAAFIMKGGTIRNNSTLLTKGGGGVNVEDGTFTMSGGTIRDNTASDTGGGVQVDGGSAFTMSGGTISGNTANGFETFGLFSGGGVCVHGSTFTMEGGTISGNTANSVLGGGVFLQDCSFTKTGGIIYGTDAGDNSNRAQADGKGHAVCLVIFSDEANDAEIDDIEDLKDYIDVLKYRDITAGTTVNMDSSTGENWTEN